LAEGSMARFQAIGETWAEGFALTRLGLEAVSAGELDAARGFHEQALVIFRALGDEISTATTLVYLGTAERAAGDLGKAAQLFATALISSRGLRWNNGFAERLAALVGIAAAIGDTERSARLIGATMARLRAAGVGRLLVSTRAAYERDLATVRDQLGEEAFTRETANGAAMSRDEVIAEALAVARDATTRQKAIPPDGLTAREAEVLGLLARGRTNQEIADELVVSLRTVERHLTNIYGKIGARNRANATAYAMTHGFYCPSG
jgi:serine/threonine-protein kinase PknK